MNPCDECLADCKRCILRDAVNALERIAVALEEKK